MISAQPPHDPYVAPAEDMARHTAGQIELRSNVPPIEAVRQRDRRDLAGYYAAIERADWNFGRLRQALAARGLTDDTQIVFLSDHGDMHGSHGQWRKTSPWEESLRVPMIIGGPSREHQSADRLDTLINQVDLAPTTLGICGLPIPVRMQGRDLSGLLNGDPSVDQPEYATFGTPVPTGHRSSIDRPWDGIVTADGWKYTRLDGSPWMLFDLTNDPYELADHGADPGYHRQRNGLDALLRETEKQLAVWPA